MFTTHIAPRGPVIGRVRSSRFLAAALAAGAVAAGGVAIATSPGDGTAAPAAGSAPIILGDTPVRKGAHAPEPGAVTLRVFSDPTVRKGAGGR
jgi:hypothetical protein